MTAPVGVTIDVTERGLAEEKFRLAVEACPNGMVMIDRDGKIVLVNAEIEQQFGYRREELIGEHIDMLFPQRSRGQYARYREEFERRPKPVRIGADRNLVGLRKDGSEFSVELGLTPIRTAKGLLVLGVIVDVSERKESEKNLAEMEGKYRGLLEAAPDAMVVVNQAGDIVLLNLQAEKQFGYRRDELLGQKVKSIIPQGFAERLLADGRRSAEDALAQQIGMGIELQGRRKDGTEFPIEIMLSPLESADGTLVTAAIRDIRLRKQMERLKDDFVATVSHELRTPLTSISASLGLLVGLWAGKLPESAARLLTIAHTNSQRLVRLINDILDIEKIESGRVVFNLGRVDILPLVQQTIESNRGFAESFAVTVRLDDTSANGEVSADPDRLAQVLTNLLSNAIKFSPSGGEVLVAVEKKGNATRISVRDHGPGVPMDFRARIFEKFAQADATDARQKGGTGLGLSIAKQIVERLGGEVGFEDAPGGGALFYADLPVWDDPVHGEIAGATIARFSLLRDASGLSQRPRILHVDDDRDVLAAVAYALRTTADVVSVESVEAARRALAVDRFDLAILDIALRTGSGLELLPNLRDSKGIDIPIIIFAAQDASSLLDEHVQAALGKSHTSIETLVATVRDRLAHRPAPACKEIA